MSAEIQRCKPLCCAICVQSLLVATKVFLIALLCACQDLIQMVLLQRQEQAAVKKEKRDLEEYIDNLLVRVMEVQPLILQSANAATSRRTYSYGSETITCFPPTTPSYPPPAYTQPLTHAAKTQQQQQNSRSKSPAKVTKGQQHKKERRSSNPFKLLSSAFK